MNEEHQFDGYKMQEAREEIIESMDLEKLRRTIADQRAEIERLKNETRCPECGCATPEEADAHECGCDAPCCALEIPETLAMAVNRQRTVIDGLVEALRSISEGLKCGDGCHYCPNCDRSMFKLKEQANAALTAAKRGDVK